MVVHKCTSLLHFLASNSSSIGRPVVRFLGYSLYSTANQVGKVKLAQDLAGLVQESLNLEEKNSQVSKKFVSTVEKSINVKVSEDKKNGVSLAQNLANLVEESYNLDETKPLSRVEHKRLLELRIKKRVKEHHVNGKFRNLIKEVVANPKTLRDAFDCIRLSSNVDLASEDGENLPFEAMAEELYCGYFDVSANTYSISTRGRKKEVLVFPNVKLKVVEEAIRIVLEVVYRPHFSKISHGCRSGRSHLSALKYVRKDIVNPNWWFTLPVCKKLDNQILAKLFSTMQDKIDDPFLYSIICSMSNTGVLNLEFGGFPKGHGLPQEGTLAPILMNIYLDLFDREMYRLSMRYEAIDKGSSTEKSGPHSVLRSWFRKQISGNGSQECHDEIRVHCCRFMDEILIAISGPKEVAVAIKSETENYFKNSLHLEFENETDVFPCDGPTGIRFLGSVVKRSLKESPAIKAVHKLKEKVKLFASQKEHSWDTGTARIGKKWLGHGLKKVKESEIKHLSDGSSLLSQISCFRKDGMETDHWYKVLLKVWMQNKNVKYETNEDIILSKHIVEPALPQDLRDSYYEFQKRVQEYITSETASTLALLPNSNSSSLVTQIIAPISIIKKRLFRYGLTNSEGYPRPCHLLVFWDDNEIVDWYAGLICRWLRWYTECDNFNEVKLIICNQVRLSCIRTLAMKYRIYETEIEKKFDFELRRMPATEDMELDIITNETTNPEGVDNDALMYGITYSGICLFSLARMVSQSRPCNCFVIGCSAAAPRVYTLHVMERQRFPGWKTGFSSCIHPSLRRRRLGLCKHHLKDLLLGNISLESINFGAWKGDNLP
ncbi:nuclear intron maturase 4, mitochondrial [Lycium ferocissimum]|uniref:nuclear intron maturase 4, mitochondrial n=1 Tax=Lycium ferocissimum TaxID=112874 RepID=UPI002815F5B0|nr:nuclear intron maturase 4, mitochondrial [Lycium ferocissimum]